jgi:hypothetical protein
MPKGKHLTKLEAAAVVEAYQMGETIPEIDERFELSQSTVVYRVRRALGPTGPEGTRPRRAPPAPVTTTPPEKVARMVPLYRELKSLERVALELEVDPATVRHYLEKAGEPRLPTGRRQIHPTFYCRICGEEVSRHTIPHGKGKVLPPRTCGKPECRAALAFALDAPPPTPRAELAHDKGGWTPKAKAGAVQRQRLEELLLVERLPVDVTRLAEVLPVEELGEYERHFELLEDRRGSRRPGAQEAIWGALSRVPVYMRLVARTEGHSAIRLLLSDGETVFDRFVSKFFASKEQIVAVSKNFRPLIAWHCSCPKQMTWQLDTILDLPEKDGLYGLCPVCGSCALNIWKE